MHGVDISDYSQKFFSELNFKVDMENENYLIKTIILILFTQNLLLNIFIILKKFLKKLIES